MAKKQTTSSKLNKTKEKTASSVLGSSYKGLSSIKINENAIRKIKRNNQTTKKASSIIGTSIIYLNSNGERKIVRDIKPSVDGDVIRRALKPKKKGNTQFYNTKPMNAVWKKGSNTPKHKWELNYENIDNKKNITTIMKKVNKVLNIDMTTSIDGSLNQDINYYNRFKIPMLNNTLRNGFPQIYFTRPDCNIFASGTGATASPKLSDSVKSNQIFQYTINSAPQLLRQLTLDNNNYYHDFMMLLNNRIGSFSLNDEFINTKTYGNTFTGHKIVYGQNNIESKTAGQLNINYSDDRMLHVYHLHKLWIEYISGVSRGEFYPLNKFIKRKILDYASSCYYFLLAEDMTTIIYWAKYYGVFPSNVQTSQYSWSKGSTISNPEIEITYMYSFKEEYNPQIIMEFNSNANIDTYMKYVPLYDEDLGHTGKTLVGSPFIQTVQEPGQPLMYKMRHRYK